MANNKKTIFKGKVSIDAVAGLVNLSRDLMKIPMDEKHEGRFIRDHNGYAVAYFDAETCKALEAIINAGCKLLSEV